MGCCYSKCLRCPAKRTDKSGRVAPETEFNDRLSSLQKTGYATSLTGYAVNESTGSLIEPAKRSTFKIVMVLVPPEGVRSSAQLSGTTATRAYSSSKNGKHNLWVANSDDDHLLLASRNRRGVTTKAQPLNANLHPESPLSSQSTTNSAHRAQSARLYMPLNRLETKVPQAASDTISDKHRMLAAAELLRRTQLQIVSKENSEKSILNTKTYLAIESEIIANLDLTKSKLDSTVSLGESQLQEPLSILLCEPGSVQPAIVTNACLDDSIQAEAESPIIRKLSHVRPAAEKALESTVIPRILNSEQSNLAVHNDFASYQVDYITTASCNSSIEPNPESILIRTFSFVRPEADNELKSIIIPKISQSEDSYASID